jgi:hypothetical protein
MLLWEIDTIIRMLPTTKMKGFIWVEAKNVYLAWFNLGFMQAPKNIDPICEYFSFVKPWAINVKC